MKGSMKKKDGDGCGKRCLTNEIDVLCCGNVKSCERKKHTNGEKYLNGKEEFKKELMDENDW